MKRDNGPVNLKIVVLTQIMMFVLATSVSVEPAHGQRNTARKNDAGSNAQNDKLDQALRIRPNQPNVDYDRPQPNEIAKCRIVENKSGDAPGFTVFDPTGRILRRFVDNNRDRNLDQWSYYKDGIEVYRDIDSDFNRKTDQYRWMGSAGTRWAIDSNQDGKIDSWRFISADEAAEETFHAIRTKDVRRFQRLLPTAAELRGLRLGSKMSKEIEAKLKKLPTDFSDLVRSQRQISSSSKWVHFSTARPSLVPKGQLDIQNDLFVYDHASAVFQTGPDDYGQLALGTMIRVDNAWRIIELPQLIGKDTVVANGGLFYPMPDFVESLAENAVANENAEKLTKLFEQFDELEKKLKTVKRDSEIYALEKQRGSLLATLISESEDKEDRDNWIRQLADTVTAAYQNDRYPDGLEFLSNYIRQREKAGEKSQLDYVQWRILSTRFAKGVQGDRRQRDEANDRFLKDLEDFSNKFRDSEFAPNAMMQIALYHDVSDDSNVKTALKWYSDVATRFPNTPYGKKARGARIRLTSQNKPLQLIGTTVDGKRFNLQSDSLRGKVIVVHYWESWCDTCIDGFEEFERLAGKYRGDLLVVGANMDNDADKLKTFLRKNSNVTWPQLHAPGGTEKSPLAMQLGVPTLPMIVLIDQRGNMVEANIAINELDREIQRLVRRAASRGGRSNDSRR